jgi:hypothetical protein
MAEDEALAPAEKLRTNETAKLTAAWLNSISLAFFGVGGLGPWVGLANGGTGHPDILWVAALSAICITLSGALHLLARASFWS